MVDKTKKGPLPEKPQREQPQIEKRQSPGQQPPADPQFVRGTIDPTTKKGR